ncbi:MAG: class I SAM-dependent methyltransferase [Pelolinea sp.]|nr:class I SAM-dependent methyltransferase [Pelolinea sp.]
MRKKLRQIYNEHDGKVSDKWTLYLEEWDLLFAPYRDLQIQLLEIGVQNGGSLEIWGKYFLKAEKIVGCDVDEKCRQLKYDDDRITVVVCDANSDDCENEILRQTPTFDIIIDDGSHKSSDVVRSFARYFPLLNDNGIYVVEDLHTSYWKDYEGGLHDPFSAIAFFKRLADVVNYEHWRNNKSRGSLLTAFEKNLRIEFEELELFKIHSIEFVNSLCIIKKLPYDRNDLGKRIIVGTDDWVTDEGRKLNGTLIQDFAHIVTDDAKLDVFELIASTNSLTSTITEREQAIQSLTAQAAEREHELNTQVAKREQAIQSLTAQAAERDALVQSLTAQVAERDQTVQTLTAQAAEREQAIQTLTAQVAEGEQTVQTLTAQSAEQSQENQTLINQLSQSQEEVLYYAMSKSWRYTRPLRKIMLFIRGKKNA